MNRVAMQTIWWEAVAHFSCFPYPRYIFSIRWTRCFPFEERYYVFKARADDYVKVSVDDLFVLEARSNNVERAFAVPAGEHCIKIEYVEGGHIASVYFEFEPGDTFPVVDPANAWKGEYFINQRLQDPAEVTRYDAEPVFDWQDSNPAPGIPVDNFSARWTRCMDFDGREYTFIARADDYMKVFVDNNVVLEARSNTVEQQYQVSSGQHCIKIEYVEGGNLASVFFDLR